MKKLVSLILVLSVVAALAVCFVGCDKTDTVEQSFTSSNGEWQYRQEKITFTTTDAQKVDAYLADGYTLIDQTEGKKETTYVLSRERYYLTSYLGNEETVLVPATVDEVEIYGLDAGCFVKIDDGSTKRRNRDTYAENTTLKAVKFELQAIEIPDRCFYLCSALQSIEFPDTLERIGDFAFYGCKALTEISFPQSLNSIGAYAFRQCGALTNVYIHNAADATMPPKIGDMCFFMVDSKKSKDDQYYIIPDLKIWVDNITVFDADLINAERKQSHTNDYKYWLNYMPDEDHPDREYIFEYKTK